jgi:hypothetical protein
MNIGGTQTYCPNYGTRTLVPEEENFGYKGTKL